MPSQHLDFPIDPSKPGKYPVVLSDALVGSTRTNIFTGVRYNHKPKLSSDDDARQAQITPSASNKHSFDLSFAENGGKYEYSGSRATGDDQYVLYWDATKEAWVLDKVDSVFHMNLTQTPNQSDPDVLARKYRQLDAPVPPPPAATATKSQKPVSKSAATRLGGAPSLKSRQDAGVVRKQPKPQPKATDLMLPEPGPMPEPAPARQSQPSKTAAARRRPAPADSESSSDDDDGGLQVEYPGGSEPGAKGRSGSNFSPAFPPAAQMPMRRFSDYMRESDDADAESDGEEQDLAAFKLPSPVHNAYLNAAGTSSGAVLEEDSSDAPAAELLRQSHDPGAESEVSEED